ncbi:MAG: hypothetical protein JWN72_312, partial [Thermoleophilia bacterium]|nr:hypothetical protein [Thermoleophilia bacterium]
MALVYVIAITMAVATLLVAVLVMTTTGIRSGARADVRNANQQTVQDAVQLYRVALESRVANEATGWVPPPRLLQTMLGARGEVVELASLAGLDRSYARPVPGAPVYAVRMQRTESVGGSFHFWQIIRVT